MPRTRCCLLACAALVAAAASGPGQTSRVSVRSDGAQDDGASRNVGVSSDGRFVAFESDADDLVAGDTNQVTDVFVFDRLTSAIERVSVAPDGSQGNDASSDPALSGDGNLVAFTSFATNLVAGDTNVTWDIIVRDRTSGSVARASVDSSGKQARLGAYLPAFSPDGASVAFASDSDDLVAGDTNKETDVFVHDLASGLTEIVSIASDGTQSDGQSFHASLSADGRRIAFDTLAVSLDSSGNLGWKIFVHDRDTGSTELASVDDNGVPSGDNRRPSLSADGQVVSFDSNSLYLDPADTNRAPDVFVHDFTAGTTRLVSVNSSGAVTKGYSQIATLSADARFVAFQSEADDLVDDDVNFVMDDFVHDRTTGRTWRVSVDSHGVAGDLGSYAPVVSGDGTTVAFESDATDLVVGDSNAVRDAFAWQRSAVEASWSNYGSGFPGKLGVPTLTASGAPALGSTISIDASNSRGLLTFGLLIVGLQKTTIGFKSGATLLVQPLLLLPIALPATGWSADGRIPDDSSLGGLSVDLQALESDSYAVGGISFTPGLELVLGF